MLIIRFLRVGKKHQPSFKIVVVDKKRAPTSGKFVEEVGFYNPLTKEKVIRKERIEYWLSQGVGISNSVYNLLIKEGVLEGPKIPVHKKKKKSKEVEGEKKVEEVSKEQPQETTGQVQVAEEKQPEKKAPEKTPEETKEQAPNQNKFGSGQAQTPEEQPQKPEEQSKEDQKEQEEQEQAK
jgi:small subunit ribosomal protein S16